MINRVLRAAPLLLIASSPAYAQDPTQPSCLRTVFSVLQLDRFLCGHQCRGWFRGADAVHTVGQAAPNIANIAGNARPGFVDLNRMGVIAGGQAGYNYQFGRYVAGVETDIAYTHFDDARNVGTAQLVTGLALNNRFRSNIDYLGTLRGRFGVT